MVNKLRVVIVKAIIVSIILNMFTAVTLGEDVVQAYEEDGRITLPLWQTGNKLLQPVNKSDNAHIRYSTSCLVLSATDGTKYEVKTDNNPWMEYTIFAEDSRYYSLHWTGVRYNLESRSSSFWGITVNPGTNERYYVVNKDNSLIKVENGANAYCDYTEEYIYLNKGVNTIRITALECNSDYSSNLRRAMIQKIELVKKINEDGLSAMAEKEQLIPGCNSDINIIDGDGMRFDSSYDNIKAITYTPSDENVAKVNSDGIITCVGLGNCCVDINITDIIGNSYSVTCDITVGDTIVVEGEEPDTMPSLGSIDEVSGLSGGKTLRISSLNPSLEADEAFVAEYSVDIPKKGIYTMYAVAGRKGVPNRTDFSIVVNEIESFSVLTDAETVENVNTEIWNGTFVKHKMGSVTLNEGINNISFIVDRNDISYIGKTVSSFLDCIIFQEDAFGINSIKGCEACNVFEFDKAATFEVRFKSEALQEIMFGYEIYDTLGVQPIQVGEFSCGGADRGYILDVGKLNPGWYELIVFEQGKEDAGVKTSFSVTPKYSARIEGESPFAADFAMSLHTGSFEIMDGLCRAASLAGIKWARERYSWKYIQKNTPTEWQSAEYDFSFPQKQSLIYKKYGINVLNMSHGFANGLSESDLFDVYNFQKTAAEELDGLNQAYQIFNETENSNISLTANDYAAVLKAAAIGIRDANIIYEPQILSAGMWQNPRDHYVDLMMKNGMADYCDAMGFHNHTDETRDDEGNLIGTGLHGFLEDDMLQERKEMMLTAAEKIKPLWITEAGAALEYNKDSNGNVTGEISKEQRLNQAYYAVKSHIESLSKGTSKHFWFLWSPYIEKDYEMGTFTSKFEPTPAYSAIAQMTYVLGKGKYKGIIASDKYIGHVIDSGKDEVVVAWADESVIAELESANDVVVTDLMGESDIIPSVNGKVSVPVSTIPCYISFEDGVSVSDYYPTNYHYNDDEERVTFSDVDKIVIRQEFFDENTGEKQSPLIAKKTGYKLNNDAETEINVVLYNFNNKSMSGVLKGELDGYRLEYNDKITIPAMSSVSVPVVVTPINNDDKKIGIQYLRFWMDINGEATSPSVAEVMMEIIDETPDIVANGSQYVDNWTLSVGSAATNSQLTQGEDGAVKIQFSTNGNSNIVAGWTYSSIKISNLSEIIKSDGVMYKVRNSGDMVRDNTLRIHTGTNQYYHINKPDEATKDEWKTIMIRWEDFTPLGHSVPLDVNSITAISVGSNFNPTNANTNEDPKNYVYEIKELGGFYNFIEAEHEIIEIKLPEFSGPYVGGQLSNLEICIPENIDEYREVKVFVDEIEYEFAGTEKIITTNLNSLTRGIHSLTVVCEKTNGFKISAQINITITDDYGIVVNDAFIDGNIVNVKYSGTAQQAKLTLVVASYNGTGGRLTEVKSTTVDILGKDKSLDLKINMELKPENIKLFWLKSLESMTPVAESTEIKS